MSGRGKTYRIWYDENGNKRESRGRPSKEEQAAKERGQTPIKKEPPKKEAIKKEPPKEMDTKAFLEETDNAIKALNSAADISNNDAEASFLRNVTIIIKEQMQPKYRKPVSYF